MHSPRGEPRNRRRQVVRRRRRRRARGPRYEGPYSRAATRPRSASNVALRERLTGDPPAHLLIALPTIRSSRCRRRPGRRARATRCCSPRPTRCRRRRSKASSRIAGTSRSTPRPREVISAEAEKEIADATERPPCAGPRDEDDPVANAIAFARYVDGTFGWNINDPGHGFVIANSSRPADAAAAAALSGSGTWGPLLLTDDARRPRRPRGLPARPEARLRGRPDPRGLQPRVDHRRRSPRSPSTSRCRWTRSPRSRR